MTISLVPSDLRVALTISGFDCAPERISEVLGVAATDVWLQGDSVLPGTHRRKMSGWRLESPRSAGSTLHSRLKWLFNALPASLEPLRAMTDSWEVELSVWLHLYEETPELTVAGEAVAALARWGAALDVDIVVGTKTRT